MKHRHVLLSLILICASLLFTTGCGERFTDRNIVLTTGFAPDEVFKLEDRSCSLPEILIYLNNTRNQYESVYGPDIWSTTVEGVNLADSVKDNALAHISQIKAMNILAAKENISLTEEELSLVDQAAKEYYGSLTEIEAEKLQATPELIARMYGEYALAHKFYREIIKDISPEISDDEARTITVLHIFIEAGSPDSYDRAKMVHDLATDGEHDFTDLTLEYSDGTISEYSFSKGEMDPELEEVAFNLGNNEVSDVITTSSGYHIIKCLSTFNREETDLNKEKISQQEKEKVFGANYDSYASTLTKYLNEELWDSIRIRPDDTIQTKSFFEIYHKYLD